jgi:hypothetical protein
MTAIVMESQELTTAKDGIPKRPSSKDLTKNPVKIGELAGKSKQVDFPQPN